MKFLDERKHQSLGVVSATPFIEDRIERPCHFWVVFRSH
jgi:hypothetical protein